MEPRNTIDSEPLDQVISETLRERMGAPPSREVWSRIAKDIAKPPPRSTFEILLAMFYTPVAQSAFIVAMLVVIVVQPAFYWINKDYPTTTFVLPYAPRSRPIPEGELHLSAPFAREQEQEIAYLQVVLPPVEAR
ncbi:MAG: hypothetical protein H0T73_01925 [Ardenticatenales bacterium]|nr:hypothetical protein [Ardenticatenales bacterium]